MIGHPQFEIFGPHTRHLSRSISEMVNGTSELEVRELILVRGTTNV